MQLAHTAAGTRPPTARGGPHRGPVSRLLATLGHTPECDPHLARHARLRPGDVVDRFELVREIGRGGFGVVFEAMDRALGCRVALKTVRPGRSAAAACESLEREGEIGGLRHPNIVSVLAAGRSERGPFVVLEYLAGETLAQRLGRGPLTVDEAIVVAVAVARALRHAHARGILHRDLKPANVFLPSAGEPKLIDFGLARVGGRAGPRGSGTSGYMSPEQQRGDPEDARTDLFALGLLLLEMVSGATERSGWEPGHSGRPDPSEKLPPELASLVTAMLERDPARRPACADTVLRALLRGRRRGAARTRTRLDRRPARRHDARCGRGGGS